MTNPYLNRSAIRDDGSFVGRTSELKRLFNRIGGAQPQSISIVGDRRIGKSSLLRALMTRRAAYLARPDQYLFVYLDMQSRLRWTPEMFFERLAESLPAGANGGLIADYDSLERWCRALQQQGRTLVLMMDEFQVLMREDTSASVLPVDFFNYLRSLANSFPVSLVVTSHVDLYTLSHDHRLSGSPLFNILHKLHLGSFTEREARELIETPSRRAGCLLTADEPWIISRGGYHPLYLQIACSVVFDWRTEHGGQVPLDRDCLDRAFMKEARPHFEGTCKQFSDVEREIVQIVARGEPVRGALTATVESLDERGYLRPDAGRLVVFSECFRQFVVEQQCVGEPAPAAAVVPDARAAKVFISYAREDQEAVADLYRRLTGIGVNPWMDQENLVIGDPWARTIDEAILSADFFLCCISTHSVDKAGVLRQELSKGLSQWYTRSGPDNYLLPVMLEDCPMPPSLAPLQRVDLWKDDGWVRLRDGLRRAIDRRKHLKTPATVFPAATVTASVASRLQRTFEWFKRRALVLGLVGFFAGVLLLIAGLSGDALSSLIGRVGLDRARNWNGVLRGFEIGALVLGALLLSLSIMAHRSRTLAIATCTAVWLVCWTLVTIEVPAPDAFALAYDRYLAQRSEDWRERLLTFFDPATGGVRDRTGPAAVRTVTTAQTVVGVLGSVGYDHTRLTETQKHQIRGAVNHLESARMSGPEEGWGYAPGRVPAITEITAWATLAEIASVRAELWDPEARAVMTARIVRDVLLLVERQSNSGGWSPNRDDSDDNTRTYSTVMALWALAAAFGENIRSDSSMDSAENGVEWLLNERHPQLGWVPNPRRRYQTEEFPGLTAQALVVLDLLRQQMPDPPMDIRLRDAKTRFVETFVGSHPIDANARVPDSDVHVALGEASTTLEGGSFLWYPWARAALTLQARDPDLATDVRERARHDAAALTLRTEELRRYLDGAMPFQLAEHLLCIRMTTEAAAR